MALAGSLYLVPQDGQRTRNSAFAAIKTTSGRFETPPQSILCAGMGEVYCESLDV
jgi:hypothetical protein